MLLKRIHAENFRAYSKIDWTVPTIGLHQIDGYNLDTGRSNMVGKSTLLDAICWAITGEIPRGGQADNVIRRGTKSCWAEVELSHNGHDIVIRRERPNKVILKVDGQIQHGKAADIDKRIPALIGMTSDQFLISVLIAQKRNKSFFSMSDTDRTEFLSIVAGLEKLNAALERVKEEKKTLESQLNTHSGAIQMLTGMVDELPAKMARLEVQVSEKQSALAQTKDALANAEAVKEVERSRIELTVQAEYATIEANYEVQLAALRAEEATLRSIIADLESRLTVTPAVEPELAQAVVDTKKLLADEEARNNLVDRVERNNERIREQIAQEITNWENSLKGSCSHCGQDLPIDQRQAKANAHLTKAKELEAQLTEVWAKTDLETLKDAASQALLNFSKRKQELEEGPARAKAEILQPTQRLNGVVREVTAADQQKRMAMQSVKQQAESGLVTLDRAIDSAKAAEKVADTGAKAATAEYDKALAEQQGLRDRLSAAQASVRDVQFKLDESLDLIDLLGPKGLRTIFFEDVIARISDRAGQLFSAMTDGIYSTRLDQVGETAKGEQRLILKPVISKGGVDVPVDDLSGGAERNITLAYDIAVTEACGDSSVLFLDEVLYGLDPIGAAEVLRLLEEVSRTRAVVVIEHASEIKAGIQNVIKVYHQGGDTWMDTPGEPEWVLSEQQA